MTPIRILPLLPLLTTVCAASANAAVTDYHVPSTARIEAGLVPAGWHVMAHAEGDLNHDGRPDAALVLGNRKESDDTSTWDLPRLLVVALRGRDGRLHRSVVSDRVVLTHGEGGIFGDPFDSLDIQRGSIVIHHYGGSRDRWSVTDRYRLQKGQWIHIGKTITSTDTLDPNFFDTVDTNLLTGYSVHSYHQGHTAYRHPYYTLQVGPVSAPPQTRGAVRIAAWPGPIIHLPLAGTAVSGTGAPYALLTGVTSGGNLYLAASIAGLPLRPHDSIRLVWNNGRVVPARSVDTTPSASGGTILAIIPLRAMGARTAGDHSRLTVTSEEVDTTSAPLTVEIIRPARTSRVLFTTSLNPTRHDSILEFTLRPGLPHLGDDPVL